MHRLGQQKAVSIHRLTIRNTVEARVLELQKRKVSPPHVAVSSYSDPIQQELAEGSLGEGSGKRIGRKFLFMPCATILTLLGSKTGPSIRELQTMFGLTGSRDGA